MNLIASSAIRKFIDSKRDNHDWLKKVPEPELDRMLEQVKFKVARPKIPLDKHQKVCIILGIAYRTFAFWLDLGGGKTRVCLELMNYWYQRGQLKRAIVTGPSDSVMLGWEKQIKEWRIKIPFVTLTEGGSRSKWDQINELEDGIILCPAASLNWLVSKKKEVGKRKKIKLKNNATLIRRLSKNLDAFIIDEATLIGHRSLTYATCVKLSKHCKYRAELTGTPFGRDPTMLWSELFFIDRGETLGSTLGMFRAAFFSSKPGYFGGYEHTFKKKYKKRFYQILKHRSIQYSEEEMGTKHKVINEPVYVDLPEEAEAYYERMRQQLKLKYGNLRERENIFLRMRQISSGFLGAKDDDTGARVQIVFAKNPKLERLLELVQQVPRNRKFVIFHEFIHSGKVITAALKKLKIKHGWIHGGIKNLRELRTAYDDDPKFGGLIVNHKIGAFGENLQAGNYCFVYEAPVPVIADKQMRKRLPRKGQRFTVHEYDLICRGTADERILQFHKEGGDLFESIIRGRKVNKS